VPLESPAATEAAVGRLIEEWAALTYSCLVEAAMESQAEYERMEAVETTVAVEREGA
jgi:hypothetical protein